MIWGISMEGSLLRYGPSMIQAQSVEGPRLDTEPSTIWSINVEGSRLDAEPSMIWGIIVEGSRLRYGPSVILSLSVEGSTPGSRTIRDMCLYRGWLALFTSNRPRNRPLAWMVRVWDMDRP